MRSSMARMRFNNSVLSCAGSGDIDKYTRAGANRNRHTDFTAVLLNLVQLRAWVRRPLSKEERARSRRRVGLRGELWIRTIRRSRLPQGAVRCRPLPSIGGTEAVRNDRGRNSVAGWNAGGHAHAGGTPSAR